jgi:hypothetical protein
LKKVDPAGNKQPKSFERAGSKEKRKEIRDLQMII